MRHGKFDSDVLDSPVGRLNGQIRGEADPWAGPKVADCDVRVKDCVALLIRDLTTAVAVAD